MDASGADRQPARKPHQPTRREALEGITRELEAVPVESARVEAERLLALAVGVERPELLLALDLPLESDEALRLARRAADLADDPRAVLLDTLAAAHAAAGDYEQAAATAERARALAGRTGHDQLAQQIDGRLRLYRTGEPYRERVGSGVASVVE